MGWQRECHGCRDRGIDCGPHHTTTPSPSSNASIKVVLLLPIREAELPRLCCLVLHLHWYSTPIGGTPPPLYTVMPQTDLRLAAVIVLLAPVADAVLQSPLAILLLSSFWYFLSRPFLYRRRFTPPPLPWSLLGSCLVLPIILCGRRSLFFPAFTVLCLSRDVSSRYSIPLSFGCSPSPFPD